MKNNGEDHNLIKLYTLMIEEIGKIIPEADKSPLDTYLEQHLVNSDEVGDFALDLSDKWAKEHENKLLPLDRAISGALIDGFCFGLFISSKTDGNG